MTEQLACDCPIHLKPMILSHTKYGDRVDCPESGCDWMCWAGDTSTPSNAAIREARNKAHIAFDELWKSGKWKRHHAYNWLSQKMGMKKKDCHIGMFGVAECKEVTRLSAERNRQ